ncbi:hypothetical protein SASPL_140694 [Salvia splendens]|uniref:Solute carrier family 15 (Peptide/histidine transporter), member 3/4 n=1 Tax=Salvia splendens TaxID=180675 RepID=A0A8X8WQ72_SALSN|nr:hypothetical protein SASPL_140694 [Salvia splendens]
MGSLELSKAHKLKEEEYTCDGSVDFHGQLAIRDRTGKWSAGTIILLNQGLATLAFFGVGVNLVLFLTRVLQQDNAEAANSVSKWTGTVYIFSLVGAFLRFSALVIINSGVLAQARGCGDENTKCNTHSSWELGLFYISIYMIALGNGGYQPNIATFGADQFDIEDPIEGYSKVAFFSYFYLALNLGSLFSNTILGYFEDEGLWALGFWASTASATLALFLFLGGHQALPPFQAQWQPPLPHFPGLGLSHQEVQREDPNGRGRQLVRDQGVQGRFLDRAAFVTQQDLDELKQNESTNPWRLCPISQVEEVKCILRLLPIWLCTIIYSVVFTQMASLFVEQGDAMNTQISNFRIPAASMSSFDILSVALFIFLYRRVVDPIVRRVRKDSNGLTELQRMGIGLVIAVMAMVSAGIVECYRLKYARKDCKHCQGSSSLSIFWQVPQYALIGASEVFMYVGQLEFFNAQAPDGLKSFGSALCMTSISLGNYVSSLLVSIVMKISTVDNMPGWIPGNLNKGHLERFYFLLAGLTAIDLMIYIACASWYKSMKFTGKGEGEDDEDYEV